MTKKKSVARKPLQVAQTKPASDPAAPATQTESISPAAPTEPKPAKPKRVAKINAAKPKPAAQTKAVSRSAPADETPDELLDRGEKSKRVAEREAALANE